MQMTVGEYSRLPTDSALPTNWQLPGASSLS